MADRIEMMVNVRGTGPYQARCNGCMASSTCREEDAATAAAAKALGLCAARKPANMPMGEYYRVVDVAAQRVALKAVTRQTFIAWAKGGAA